MMLSAEWREGVLPELGRGSSATVGGGRPEGVAAAHCLLHVGTTERFVMADGEEREERKK